MRVNDGTERDIRNGSAPAVEDESRKGGEQTRFTPKGASFPGGRGKISALLTAAKERRKTRWTREEDKLLRESWGEYNISSIYEMLPGRTLNAIKYRAKHLGLKFGIPQGFVSVKEAARRIGLSFQSMNKFLRDYGIQKRNVYPARHIRCRKQYRWYVEWDQVVDLYDEHCKLWTHTSMAAHVKVSRSTFQQWMRRNGLHKPARRSVTVYYTQQEAENIFEKYQEWCRRDVGIRELMKRTGLGKEALRKKLIELGLYKPIKRGGTAGYTKEEADRIVASC